VIVYWFIALPAGLALAFQADWGLYGLWAGMLIALGLCALVLGVAVYRSDWQKIVEQASKTEEAT